MKQNFLPVFLLQMQNVSFYNSACFWLEYQHKKDGCSVFFFSLKLKLSGSGFVDAGILHFWIQSLRRHCFN